MTEQPAAPRVLLVEDSPSEGWLLAEILRSRGYTVVACESGEEAMAAWREAPSPMVVLDWMLPGMSGGEVCQAIRKTAAGRHAVILVVTGKNDPADLEAVLASGADDYVAKPVDVGLLNIRLAVAERNVRDAESRKVAEEALAQATQELQTLFENLGSVYFSVDLRANRLIQVSPTVEDFLGIPHAELDENPERWPELLPGVDPVDVLAQLGKLEEKRALILELMGIRKSDDRWLEASIRPQRAPDGTLLRIDGVISDVSERRRSQLQLAARNQELQTLHQISEITLTSQSLEDGYARILGVAAQSLGFPIGAVEILEESSSRLRIAAAVGLEDSLGAVGRLVPLDGSVSAEALKSGHPEVVEDLSRRRGLSHTLTDEAGLHTVIAFPMILSGEALGVLSFAHTEVAPPPPRTIRWGTSLANQVATFTDRLRTLEALRTEETRYRVLAGELQRANQELESFGYTVSHDLRAPLRTMQGFAHTLLQDYGSRLDAKGRGYLERILASGSQSELLIRDLLTYSRLSLEEIQLDTVSLDEVVSVAISQLEADLRESRARLEVQERLPRVLGHQTTLVQVVSNLLSNAVKFAKEGEQPTVRLRAEMEKGQVRLWVEDDGVGIPEDQLDRVFRAFERGTLTQARPGTGIGLAVVRRGVERMGGSAGVESSPGKGARFWIELRSAD